MSTLNKLCAACGHWHQGHSQWASQPTTGCIRYLNNALLNAQSEARIANEEVKRLKRFADAIEIPGPREEQVNDL